MFEMKMFEMTFFGKKILGVNYPTSPKCSVGCGSKVSCSVTKLKQEVLDSKYLCCLRFEKCSIPLHSLFLT